MPIQPMSVGYDPVPDVEDVTPIGGNIDNKTKNTFRTVAIAVTVLVIALLFGAVIYVFTHHAKQIHIYQTSVPLGEKMKELNIDDLRNKGFNVPFLKFGNAECTEKEHEAKQCELPSSKTSAIMVNAEKHYQHIIGFGGAFTEAAAINFKNLPNKIKEKVLDLYFGEDGIGYTLGRVPINSCDFSPASYNFDDIDGDYDLQYFDNEVTHDNEAMIPFILKAMATSKLPIKLLASPWSPPAWMKNAPNGNLTERKMTGSATPNGLMDSPKIKTTWASYISKWIEAYNNKGVHIWAITPQNEPEFPAPWEACAYTPSYEKVFVSDFLGPIIKQNHPDVLILPFDHNKDHLHKWAKVMLLNEDDDSETSINVVNDYVDGMAFHWYAGNNDRLMDGTYGYNNVNKTHYMAPNKILLATEGCSCPGVRTADVIRAERLAHDVMFDLLHWANGWIDWNLIVNHNGGINHLGNDCEAPIVTTKDFDDIIIVPKFYYMGHFSKFVKPDSIRIGSSFTGSYQYSKIDPNVRAGFELGLFNCEQSSRQMWEVTHEKRIRLVVPAIDSEWETIGIEKKVNLCFGPGDTNRPYLHIVDCMSNETSPYEFEFTSNGMMVEIESGDCLTVADDVTVPGGLLHLERCVDYRDNHTPPSPSQQFYYDENTHELVSLIASSYNEDGTVDTDGLCVTAGWPFFTGAAFLDDNHRTIVVIMNEAGVDTQVVLSDTSNGDVWFGINARSIQTIVY